MNLKGDVHNVKKGYDSMDAYLQKIKVIRDKLMAAGVFLDDEELLHVAIKGLPKEFSAVRSAIRTRSTKLSFNELATLLDAEEESLNEGMEIKDSTFAMLVDIALYLTTLVVIIITTSLIIKEEGEIKMEEVEAEVHHLITSTSFHNLKVLMLDQKANLPDLW